MSKNKKVSIEEVLAMTDKYIHDEEGRSLIRRAYEFASEHHANQYRKSGEPYIVHPIQVASILAQIEIDPNTIAAAFLHDLVEDTEVTQADIQTIFNEQIMKLVAGVTKLSKMTYKSSEQTQAENHRRMFVAMTNDFRVMLIKFADRLHNMRTLKHLQPEKQIRIANETLEIFAPLANRLGISEIQWELEDLALRYLDPEYYFKIANLVRQKREERQDFLNDIMKKLRLLLKENQIDGEVYGRTKHFYSVYRKMVFKQRPFDVIYDLIAVRIIVPSVQDCYATLGAVHTKWISLKGRLKDFIAMPKSNMYQSIHTTVIAENSIPFEVQIRTKEMHKIAQYGIAAHWAYKQGTVVPSPKPVTQKLNFLREFVELQISDTEVNDVDFMQNLKSDLLAKDMVYVYTPKGDVYELPLRSIPIDFAYRVHTEIGDRMVGAKINGKIVAIDTPLQTGDIVEVMTNSQGRGPSLDWLKKVKSNHAKNKIKQFFKKQNREDHIKKGKEMLERDFRELGLDFKELLSGESLRQLLNRFNFSSFDDIAASIGFGDINTRQITNRFTTNTKNGNLASLEDLKPETTTKLTTQSRGTQNGVILPGVDNLLIRLAKCCSPIPNDEIIGIITKGRGVSVHRIDCPNVDNMLEKSQLISDIKWCAEIANFDYLIGIKIKAANRANLLSDVLGVMNMQKITIESVLGRFDKNKDIIISMTIHIKYAEQMKKIFAEIEKIPSIFEVIRVYE